MQEEIGIFGRADGLKGARHLVQVEEAGKIRGGASIREIQPPEGQAEVVLDKAKDAAEIVAHIVDVSRGV